VKEASVDYLKRALGFACFCLYFAYVLLPILLLLAGSFGERWFSTLLPEGFTLKWYWDLFTNPMYTKAIGRSLLVAGLTVLLNAAISVPAVYAVHTLQLGWLRNLYDSVILLPIAVPPIVMGLGLIQSFNWPGFSLVGTWQLLLGAHVVYTLPFTLRPLMANLEMIQWNVLEEAGLSLGAGMPHLFRRVLVPNLMPGILSGALMTFAMSLGEFQLAVMLTSSNSQTYPVVLYQAFYVSTGFACSATMVLIVTSLFTLVGVLSLGRLFGMGKTQILFGGGS